MAATSRCCLPGRRHRWMNLMSGRVLIVDDDPALLCGYRHALGGMFEILTAANGKEGLGLVRKHDFAAVVSDMRMPGIDGLQFLGLVRDLQPQAVRILLSGFCVDTVKGSINFGLIHGFVDKVRGFDALGHELQAKLKTAASSA